jgi:hypothetical protein
MRLISLLIVSICFTLAQQAPALKISTKIGVLNLKCDFYQNLFPDNTYTSRAHIMLMPWFEVKSVEDCCRECFKQNDCKMFTFYRDPSGSAFKCAFYGLNIDITVDTYHSGPPYSMGIPATN